MRDLVVIGSGFWGGAISDTANTNHVHVEQIDSRESWSASRAATGMVCEHWYRQDTVKSMLPADWKQQEIDDSIAWLEDWGLVKTGERFFNLKQNTNRIREDCWLLPNPKDTLKLLSPFVYEAKVSSLVTEADRVIVNIEGSKESIETRKVAIAAGKATDNILEASGIPPIGVKPLRGSALVINNHWEHNEPHTYLVRPYTHYTFRRWGNLTRLGDTVERSDTSRVSELVEFANRNLNKEVQYEVLTGLRPVCEEMQVRPVNERIFVATGGHRVGLGLSKLVADKVMAWL